MIECRARAGGHAGAGQRGRRHAHADRLERRAGPARDRGGRSRRRGARLPALQGLRPDEHLHAGQQGHREIACVPVARVRVRLLGLACTPGVRGPRLQGSAEEPAAAAAVAAPALPLRAAPAQSAHASIASAGAARWTAPHWHSEGNSACSCYRLPGRAQTWPRDKGIVVRL